MSILRTSQVTALTGLSRTTLWRLERAGAFPTRVQLGANSVGWRAEEVKAWIEGRPRAVTQARGR
jgi:prophage regulatory protein